MRRLLAALGAVLFAIGCGGAGARNGQPLATGQSPFSGAYTGSWNWAYLNEDGNTAGTIAGNGQFAIVENDPLVAGVGSALICGAVQSNGTFTGSYQEDQQTTPIGGSFLKTAQGQVQIQFPFTIGGMLTSNRITLNASQPVSYQGSYAGAWSCPSLSESGNAAFIIGPGGEFYGSYTTTAGVVTRLIGIVTADGLFSGAAYSGGHNVGSTGSFTMSGQSLTGSVTEAVSGNTDTFSFVLAQ